MSNNKVNYKVTTNYGKFIVRITVTLDRDTSIPISYNINIGSKKNYCVQLRVPSIESGETDAYLMWVEANESCSLEKYIQSGISKHMVLLGLTLTRRINKNIQTVSFDDTSSFECELPNDKEIKVPMKPFHIAFHEATWYEYYFGAKLKRNYKTYCELKKNMYKSENKPNQFNFVNRELQEELDPLYQSTTNWHDFFELISNKYGKRKCGIIYPWIINAMYEIFESNIFDDTKWYIDLKENKLPFVEFNMIKVNQEGGKPRDETLKNRKNRRYTFSRTHIFPNIPDIQKWNYKKFSINH